LILLAWITSIPDTLLSVKSSKKWDADAGMSNAVGSNIFDICIWLGLPILIWTLAMWLKPEVNFNDNIGVFGFLMWSVLIYFLLLSKKNLWKKDGIYLLLVYLVFIAYIVYIATKI
jgi:cation:H+ antiporter